MAGIEQAFCHSWSFVVPLCIALCLCFLWIIGAVQSTEVRLHLGCGSVCGVHLFGLLRHSRSLCWDIGFTKTKTESTSQTKCLLLL